MRTLFEPLEGRLCLSAMHHGIAHHAPSQPYGLIAVAQPDATIQLAWVDDNPAVSAFVVQRSTGGGRFARIARLTGVESYVDTRVSVSRNYTYRVYAANIAVPSNSATAGVLNVVLSTTLNSVQISWQPLSSTPQSYTVSRRLAQSSSGFTPLALVLVGTTTGTSLTDTPPDDGQTYTYSVESTTGDAGGSVPVTIWPLPVTYFASTTFLGSDNHYSVHLSWTNNSQYVSQFEIERSTDGGQTWPVVYYVAGTATDFTDTDVPDGAKLHYQIAEIPV